MSEELIQQVKGRSDSREEEEYVATTTTTGEEERSSGRLHSDESNQRRREGKQQQQQQQLELRLGGGRGREEDVDEELGQQEGVVMMVEKEHMFDKVVTPSDVGKLNRLVIPKQHAEKYFPLDSSSNEKGLLLNFEDRSGKLWRFRYSYWNSSQSYVMTKGWSRFVKDKKLDAGDVVSFHRGVGQLYRHRLYIDWRPRSHHHYSNSISTLPYFLPNNNYYYAINARSPLYTSNPHPYPYPYPYPYPHPHHLHQHPNSNYNYNNNSNNNYYTLHQHQQYPHPPQPDHNYYLTTSPIPQQQEADRMIIDSVPIAHHHHHHHHHHDALITATVPAPAAVTPTTSGKRLRLFGVNMECASSRETHMPVPQPLPSSTPRFGDPRGETSLHPSSHSSAQ